MSRRPNFGNMGGMGNMKDLLKKAQAMQKEMTAARENLQTQEFTAKSADDLVTVTFNGARKLKALTIKPEAIDPDDPDMLQDLIIDAVNKGIEAVNQANDASMSKYTKGLM